MPLIALFVTAFIVGLLVTAVFVAGFRRRGPWNSVVWFFLVVFLAAWAGGLWMKPYGPTFWGLYWLPMLLLALLFGLLLAATTPVARPRSAPLPKTALRQEEATSVAIGTFFWVLIAVFALSILVRALG
jgi:hypothetical protein